MTTCEDAEYKVVVTFGPVKADVVPELLLKESTNTQDLEFDEQP